MLTINRRVVSLAYRRRITSVLELTPSAVKYTHSVFLGLTFRDHVNVPDVLTGTPVPARYTRMGPLRTDGVTRLPMPTPVVMPLTRTVPPSRVPVTWIVTVVGGVGVDVGVTGLDGLDGRPIPARLPACTVNV